MIQLENLHECPVCGEPHSALARFGGFAVIPCKKVTPTGNVALFPKKAVCVVGAGLWVDEAPTTATDEEAQLRLEIARMEEAAAAPKPADALAALRAKRDALKARADSAPPPTPPPTAETTTTPEPAGASGVAPSDVAPEGESETERDARRRRRA